MPPLPAEGGGTGFPPVSLRAHPKTCCTAKNPPGGNLFFAGVGLSRRFTANRF
jgi:hypothetical protein